MKIFWLLPLLLVTTGFSQSIDQGSDHELIRHLQEDKDLFSDVNHKSITFEQRMEKTSGNIRLEVTDNFFIEPEYESNTLGTIRGVDLFLKRQIGNSQIVATAVLTRQVSETNTNHDGIITECVFKISDVLHSRPELNISKGDIIYVARPGGITHVNNRVIEVKRNNYPFLSLNKTYLLFLKKPDKSDSYVVDHDGILEVNDNKISGLQNHPNPLSAYWKTKDDAIKQISRKSEEVLNENK